MVHGMLMRNTATRLACARFDASRNSKPKRADAELWRPQRRSLRCAPRGCREVVAPLRHSSTRAGRGTQ
jgi:hypothetical protein